MGEPNNRVMTPDARLKDMCEAIRDHVDNLGRSNEIATSTCDGVEIGYRVKEFKTFLRREVFIKTPGYKIEEMSDEERKRVMVAVFDTFLILGAAMPEIQQVNFDCMLMTQDVIPMIQVERSPGLVSIAGGFDARH